MKLLQVGRLTVAIGATWGVGLHRGLALTWLQVGALVVAWVNHP